MILYTLDELTEGDLVIRASFSTTNTTGEQFIYTSGKLQYVSNSIHELGDLTKQAIDEGWMFMKIASAAFDPIILLQRKNDLFITALNGKIPDIDELAKLRRLNNTNQFENIKLVAEILTVRYDYSMDIQ